MNSIRDDSGCAATNALRGALSGGAYRIVYSPLTIPATNHPRPNNLVSGKAAFTILAMAQKSCKDGTIPFDIPGRSDIPCFTYYKIFGELSSGAPPVVVLHGGPGAGHEYLLPFAELWPQYGLPVIFYDQIGCASSTHLPQTAGDEEFWQETLFIAELNNLLDYLHLREGPGFHLLGQSWGGSKQCPSR